MSWWDRRKKRGKSVENLCHVCGVNQLPPEPAILRLKVQDGTAEMYACDECADFFDKSADVLSRGRKKEPLDLGGYEEEE